MGDPTFKVDKPSPGVNSTLVKPQYRDDWDHTVRSTAQKVNHQSALQWLDEIKNDFFGNSDKVLHTASSIAGNKTLGTLGQDVDGATATLSGYWEGGAANAYKSYAGNVSGVLKGNQAQVANIANGLGACVSVIYELYAQGIKLIGHTANDITTFALQAGIEIGGGGPIGALWAAKQLIGLLNGFVNSAVDLLASGVSAVGRDAATGINFQAYSSQYYIPNNPAQNTGNPPMGDPGLWQPIKRNDA